MHLLHGSKRVNGNKSRGHVPTYEVTTHISCMYIIYIYTIIYICVCICIIIYLYYGVIIPFKNPNCTSPFVYGLGNSSASGIRPFSRERWHISKHFWVGSTILVGGFKHLEKYESPWGLLFPIYGKSNNMFGKKHPFCIIF